MIRVDSLYGMRVIVSPHAMVPPKPAITLDMREMVEELSRRGEVRMRPGCYQMGNRLVMHPALAMALPT